MGNLVIKAALAYLEKHPEVIEQLVEALIKNLLKELTEKFD